MKYLFLDLDDTLCLSRQEVKPNMVAELRRLSENYKIAIVGGRTVEDMMAQIPLNLLFMGQNGNIIHQYGGIHWTNELSNKEKIYEHVNLLAKEYNFKIGDDMLEDRGSQIVVSFVGFHAPYEIKQKFDSDRKIRLEMLKRFPHPNAYVAGTTGIDYIPKTKGENIQYYLELEGIKPTECLYIGDALDKGCNDYSVCGVIPTFAVKNPDDTLKFIKEL